MQRKALAEKKFNLAIQPDDKAVIIRLKRAMVDKYGPVSVMFIIRQALKALEKELAAEKAGV